MTPLAELQMRARELAIVSHALGVKVQGHDLRLACVEAAAGALTLRPGAIPERVQAVSAAIEHCNREITRRVLLWAKADPVACRSALAEADRRIAAELAKLEHAP